ncbi:Cobalt-zinc-cadmium resistance protein CzcB [Roseovarius gaetbuli]|uniref:Cobalt-zinc-cadmium resistance protein CzcB n=1 Tax=Roseovarius gaetbuli TaxID=1356575 RepID=A0A1X6ZVX1_9RHOB|nr:efflux RND transporter periplasmic adaptor subunit [Roseovarius gaetbuli]SLN62439.1 Cobalt-zinc-cadmium resistance protein CzcB [Roseovarius gaetbuli]
MIRFLVIPVVAMASLPVQAQGFDCLMDPAEVIELGSPVAGLLDEVLVDRGDIVTKGQVVARLNSAVEQSTVELLRTRANSTAVIDAQSEQLAMVEKRFERIKGLREKKIATVEAYDQVEAERIAARSLLFQAELNREIAEQELQRAEIILQQRTIRSPADGVVDSRNLVPGEYVGTDDHLLTILKHDPLIVEAFLPVEEYSHITVGDGATVHPAPPLEGSFAATVTSIDSVFDAASATFSVFLELPNPDRALPAGHRCTLTFDPA